MIPQHLVGYDYIAYLNQWIGINLPTSFDRRWLFDGTVLPNKQTYIRCQLSWWYKSEDGCDRFEGVLVRVADNIEEAAFLALTATEKELKRQHDDASRVKKPIRQEDGGTPAGEGDGKDRTSSDYPFTMPP